MWDRDVVERAACHAALGDPARVAIVDALACCDRTPAELQALLGLASNLLAHHLGVLERAGVVFRHRSSGDGRRRYVTLRPSVLDRSSRPTQVSITPALFVCTHNSARSQLAAALWRHLTGQPATSAGTHPAPRVHRGAVACARRAGLDLAGSTPRLLDRAGALPDVVVTVCDRAHEELAPPADWLHWSIADPVPVGTASAFDDAREALQERIGRLIATAR